MQRRHTQPIELPAAWHPRLPCRRELNRILELCCTYVAADERPRQISNAQLLHRRGAARPCVLRQPACRVAQVRELDNKKHVGHLFPAPHQSHGRSISLARCMAHDVLAGPLCMWEPLKHYFTETVRLRTAGRQRPTYLSPLGAGHLPSCLEPAGRLLQVVWKDRFMVLGELTLSIRQQGRMQSQRMLACGLRPTDHSLSRELPPDMALDGFDINRSTLLRTRLWACHDLFRQKNGD